MRKRLLLFMLAIGFAGMTVAQDVYSSGYFKNSAGSQTAGVWKNGTLLHSNGSTADYPHESTDVVVRGSDVYWVDNASNSSGYIYGDVWKNGTRYLSNPNGGGSHIYALAMFESGTLWSVGCTNVGGVRTAARWKNSDNTVSQLGTGSHPSEAFGACIYENYVYSCGYQNSSASAYKGVIWKGTNSFVTFPSDTKLYDITYYRGNFYVVGTMKENGSTSLKVWSVSSAGGTPSVVYTLSTSSNEISRCKIHIEAGDIFVNGQDGAPDKIWKNGTELYSNPKFFTSVVVNTNGVYYAGSVYEGSAYVGKIWKDGSVLYSPANALIINNMFIAEPECTLSEVRSLPFIDGFENGATSWPCWTKVDVDNNNAEEISYWTRGGEHPFNSSFSPATGDYCAYHRYGDASQEGWLISPKLFLQPGRDNTTLTFKSCLPRSAYYYPGGCSVWISTSGTNTSNFTKIWEETNPSNSWSTKTINLKEYQGNAVYIAFRFANVPSGGSNNHCWMIDNVSVTEEWDVCSSQTVPYQMSFNDWNWQSSCWYNVDYDMSGGSKHWKYSESEQCAYHPWGQEGVGQYGCLFSPNVTLAAGKDYVLKFKTKSQSSGSNMSNKVYIKLDGTGIPTASSYSTKIWEDNNFSNSWVDVEVPLTSYAGHNISFSFEYSGTYAHHWFIKDVRVEEAIAQYTITANSNNNAWGTVTGGGTYNAGATCTLTATPTSGYQFQNWKKNGSVVSTNATYSFTVTESATYTATFGEVPVNYFTITTNVTPAGSGTVTGGGTFQEGSSITLTATPNTGFSFSKWSDGNTQNPRTITVTANATYTAQFTQDTYTLTVTASPASGGTVSGGGTYHYGDNATLTATANANYEFQGWSDGSTDNPHTITVTGNATYTATFSEAGAVYYPVTVNADPAEGGTVSGGGTYEAGTNALIEATANDGYTFSRWSDGSTQNPRTVLVDGPKTFTAIFTRLQYTITVAASPTTGGTVSGGGLYYYGDNATLRATAYSGYQFAGWSDGSSEAVHTITVTGNTTYTATFTPTGSTSYYTVTAHASPSGSGTISGTGVFAAGSSTTLTATAKSGYTFDRWNDGSTQNPRTVTVNNNMSFTAYFNSDQFTITTNVTPAGSGTVTGGGTYSFGAMAVLNATPNSGYEFLQWSDGVMRNPRTIRVSADATYTAVFGDGTTQTYTVTVSANDPALGEVMGGGSYPAGTPIEISAYPNAGASFVKWDDGNTDNPRSVTVTGDMEFVAEFATAQAYTITVESANPEMGQAHGGGSYMHGETIQISAQPLEGYVFTKWDDNNTDNPRTITVTGNATYKAHFASNSVVTHTLTLICNTSEGTVSGGGVYVHNSEAVISATPHEGYRFVKWSDDNTDNPRVINLTSDMVLVAFFTGTSVDENEGSHMAIYPNPATNVIRLIGIEANSSIEIYNSLGELVKVVNAGPDDEIGIKELAQGLYLVRCGNATMRFVKTL